MDIVEYLHYFGSELQGLNPDPNPEAREAVLRYAKERLQDALEKIWQEVQNGSEHDE